MKNLSVKKQYIIINAIMCLVVAVIAIACITFTSMPTRPITATTADNDIPLSDTAYDGNGQLCGKNLFNSGGIRHPNFNSITNTNNSLIVSKCDGYAYNYPRISFKLKFNTTYTMSFSAFANSDCYFASGLCDIPDNNCFPFYSCGGDYQNANRISTSPKKFTKTFTTNNLTYDYIFFGVITPGTYTPNALLTILDFQIEEGSVATSYEPFIDSLFNINYMTNVLYGTQYFSKDLRTFGTNNSEIYMLYYFPIFNGVNYKFSHDYSVVTRDSDFGYSGNIYAVKKGFSSPNLAPKRSLGLISALEDTVILSGQYSSELSSDEYLAVLTSFWFNSRYPRPKNIDDIIHLVSPSLVVSCNIDNVNDEFIKFHYDNGFNSATKSWSSLFPSIFGSIGGFFKSMLDIDIMGMNLLSILGGVGAIIISLILIRLVVK